MSQKDFNDASIFCRKDWAKWVNVRRNNESRSRVPNGPSDHPTINVSFCPPLNRGHGTPSGVPIQKITRCFPPYGWPHCSTFSLPRRRGPSWMDMSDRLFSSDESIPDLGLVIPG